MVTCSIIIPSFNTRELTQACIQAILDHPPHVSYEIIVVDNNSSDGTDRDLASHYSKVQLIKNTVNRGFGKACNQGAAQAQGTYFLFLNSDAELLEGAVDALVGWMNTNPRSGIVGPELIGPDRSLFQMSWGWNPIFGGEFLQRFFAPSSVREHPYKQRWIRGLQRKPRPVPYICGASLLIRADVFRQIRGFDEDFELYFEDADLCQRCWKAGWSVDFVPEAKTVHHLGQAVKQSWGLTSLVYRQSQITYYRKHAPVGSLPLLKLYLLCKWVKVWFKSRGAQDSEVLKTYLRDFWAIIFETHRVLLSNGLIAKRSSVLIVKLSAIGDVVLTTPAIEAIRRKHPEAEIVCLTGRWAAPLLEKNPNIDRLWVIDETIFWRKRLGELFRLFFQLRAVQFKVVYVFHWSPLFHAFFWLMGIPERVGFAREGHAFHLTRSVPYVEGAPDAHDVNQYLHAVSDDYSANGPVQHPPRLFLAEDEVRSTRSWLLSQGASSHTDWICIAPGGGNNPKLAMPQKRWPAEYFAQFIDALLEQEKLIGIVLGDSSETQLLDSVASPRLKKRLIQGAGRLTLRQAAAAIQISKLFIGNDSGLLHVAGAVGTPSMSFFGPTSPLGKAPIWTTHRVMYTGETCSPCYKYGIAPPCPYNLKCLWNITPEQALAAVRPLLHPERTAHAS